MQALIDDAAYSKGVEYLAVVKCTIHMTFIFLSVLRERRLRDETGTPRCTGQLLYFSSCWHRDVTPWTFTTTRRFEPCGSSGTGRRLPTNKHVLPTLPRMARRFKNPARLPEGKDQDGQSGRQDEEEQDHSDEQDDALVDPQLGLLGFHDIGIKKATSQSRWYSSSYSSFFSIAHGPGEKNVVFFFVIGRLVTYVIGQNGGKWKLPFPDYIYFPCTPSPPLLPYNESGKCI